MSFVPVGQCAAIPAANTEPTLTSGSVVTLDGSGNVLEIEGTTDGAGTNKVFVLRKRYTPTGFQYVPFAPDKAIQGEDVGDGSFRFWDRLVLGETALSEQVVMYVPAASGTALLTSNVRLVRA